MSPPRWARILCRLSWWAGPARLWCKGTVRDGRWQCSRCSWWIGFGGQEGYQCDVPPEGWVCTRPAGHAGPCAAKPIPQPQVEDEAYWRGYRKGLGDAWGM